VKRIDLSIRALVIVVLLLAAGCAAVPRWPAISDPPTGVLTSGRWVWVELFTEDVAAAKVFYGEIFGWKFERVGRGDDAYTLIHAGDRRIAGIVHYKKPKVGDRAGRWLGLMSVPDVSRAVAQAVDGLGEVILGPKGLEGRGEVALLADPEGALFGVIRSDTGDPPDSFPPINTWLWMELWAKNASRMAEFYRGIGAYKVMCQESSGDRTELYLVANGYPRGGIIELQSEDVPSAWLPYVRVKDLKETLARVKRAGGRVMIEPSPDIRSGKVAVFIDSLGAAVGVAEWPEKGK
jgi:predicted enzyme related to lactoylglutathione lyase